MPDVPDDAGAPEEFLKRHVRPYDPETDDYERPPFAADIKPHPAPSGSGR